MEDINIFVLDSIYPGVDFTVPEFERLRSIAHQYKPKVFLITIRTCDHDSPHTGSLYILPMYYLYAK